MTLGCSLGRAETTTDSSPASGPAGTVSSSTFPSSTVPRALPFRNSTYPDLPPVDLSLVTNLRATHLDRRHLETLSRLGFIATRAGQDAVCLNFADIYEQAARRGLPLLVTRDALLNAYRRSFAQILQRLEESHLWAQALAFSFAMRDASQEQWRTARDEEVKEAALANLAYFSVGLSLLDGRNKAPPEVGTIVAEELELVTQANKRASSPTLGYLEDYSQYRPRGHYTRTEELERYFRAMSWYTRATFWVDEKPGLPDLLSRRLLRQAELMSLALSGEAEEAWSALYEPVSFLAGPPDDLTFTDLREAMAAVYGGVPTVGQLEDESKFQTLKEQLRRLPASGDLPSASVAGVSVTGKLVRSFRVMGKRLPPDAYVLQQLMHPYTTNDRLPVGLELAAVLGSDQAYALASGQYGRSRVDGWTEQLMKAKAELESPSSGIRPDCLQTRWLDTLREAFASPPPGAPSVMTTRAWARRGLAAGLSSWTEFRHDSIVYAMQPGQPTEEEPQRSTFDGYVEPYPSFYRCLGEMAEAIASRLEAAGALDPVIGTRLQTLAVLSARLEKAAEKELAAVPLDAVDRAEFAGFDQLLRSLEELPGSGWEPAFAREEDSAIVVDVYTDYLHGQVRQEATGRPLSLYVVLDLGAGPRVFAGAMYDYREFERPVGRQMINQEWRALLDRGEAPGRPGWIEEFTLE